MRVIWPEGLLLLPYVPLGFVLLLLRIFIYPHALLASLVLVSCSMIKRLVLRIMCFVLGFVVWVKVQQKPTDNQNNLPIVSNHVTLFDHLMISLSKDCITPHQHVFHWHSSHVELKNESICELLGRSVQKSSSTVQLFPESSPSDSPEYLLVFDSGLFDSLDKVQPVALKICRPFPIKILEYPIVWYIEWLWHLFVPFTCYHIEYLEPMGRSPGETSADFAERVRRAIGLALSVRLSDITSEQLHRRHSRTTVVMPLESASYTSSFPVGTVSPQSSTPTLHSPSVSSVHTLDEPNALRYRGPKTDSSSSPPTVVDEQNAVTEPDKEMFDHLISVVQEVLNDVPIHEIRKVLILCDGDVDATIDALVTSDTTDPEPKSEVSLIPTSRLSTAANTFHVASEARQTSLAERRKMLLTHACERFRLTHSPETH